ncbi:MAG: alanine--tRNA ligase [Chlamydiota bacterium]
MLSQRIRKKFLTYFKEKNHFVVPSSPTVPHDDPSLLFINAGMNQFKDVFLGKSKRDYNRATSCQKCIRVGGKHSDLDHVGHTSRHMTFFEMLGNFSFGDYSKKEAIAFAWQVTTEIFQYDPERVWVSVFETDDEAYTLWKSHIDEKRIIRLGEDENFWSMGHVGPCGPCTELLYDRGDRFGLASHPSEDETGERYSEFWNLVFMEFNRDGHGNMAPLPTRCIDTGAGLERIVSFKTEATSLFQSDILRALIGRVEELSGKPYDPSDPHLGPAFHVVADHIRPLAFAIADGAQPSNTDRGYVLRKILRRAVRYGQRLGFNQPFLAAVFPRLVDTMGKDYPELKRSESQIGEILTLEEESFFRTLRRGGSILTTVIDKAGHSNRKEISGEDAFKLKDTYGFPLEEILLIAKDSRLTVDLESYEILDRQARERSRQAKADPKQTARRSTFETFVKHHGSCSFVGYDKVEAEGSVIGLIIDGQAVEIMERGQEGLVILDRTPFYPEKGGQVGDTGTLTPATGKFKVNDCQTPYPGVIIHDGVLEQGTLIIGEPVVATIDRERRYEIGRHHTAAHLLHWALEQVLGAHIKQGGSLVERSRLRFDFNHHKALSTEEIRQIEQLVNEKIWENKPLEIYELPFEEAQKQPEIKQFFGEKYGAIVRVVAIDRYSKELCGGTHVRNLGDVGYFRIAREGSVAKGMRRIEAVLGAAGEKLRYAVEDRLLHLASLLKSAPHEAANVLKNILQENGTLKKERAHAREKALDDLATALLRKVKRSPLPPFLSAIVDIETKELHRLGNTLMKKMESGILCLSIVEEKKCHLYLKISPDLVQRGIRADSLIKHILTPIAGSGGGTAEWAQARGTNPQGVEKGMTEIEKIIRDR